MTSQVTIQLDPVPQPEPWDQAPDLSGTIASLTAWMGRHPGLIVDDVAERRTTGGLPVAVMDIAAVRQHPGVQLLVPRANPAGGFVVDVSHYAQRLYLVDIGGGHVLSVFVVAYDGSHDTLLRFDAAFAPILDSISPPATIAP